MAYGYDEQGLPLDEQGLAYAPYDVIRFGPAYDYLTATTEQQRQFGAEYNQDLGSEFLNTFNQRFGNYGYDPVTATTAAQRYFGAESTDADAYRAFIQDVREGLGPDYDRAVGLLRDAGYADSDIANYRTNLLNDAGRTDAFAFLGDNLFPALTLFGLAAGGAALSGGFAAEGGAAAGAGVGAEALSAPVPATLGAEGAIATAATPEALSGLGTVGAGSAGGLGAGGAGAAASIPLDVGLSIPASIPAGAVGAGGVGAASSGGLFGAGGVLGTGLTAGQVLSAAGPIVSGVTGLIGAGEQADAARDAARTQADAGREANAFLRDLITQQREDAAPFRQAGLAVLPELTRQALVGQPGHQPFVPQSPLDPNAYAFTPPTADTLPQDPGYQFRLREGQRLLERSAAGKGILNSGGTLRDLTTFAQGSASQEYQNAYGRALTQNQLGYERAQQQNQDAYARGLAGYQTNFQNRNALDTQNFNRLASVAGIGQVAQGNTTALGTQTGQNIANNLTSIGAANAAGQVGAGNAYAGGLSALGNAAQTFLLTQLLQDRRAV